jgi:nucleoside-diphosphate-sugar epimerase
MLNPPAADGASCQIVITGGAGFLGVRLARALLAQGSLSCAGGAPRPISRLTLVDRAVPPDDLMADPRVLALTGDLNQLLGKKSLQPPWLLKRLLLFFIWLLR